MKSIATHLSENVHQRKLVSDTPKVDYFANTVDRLPAFVYEVYIVAYMSRKEFQPGGEISFVQ